MPLHPFLSIVNAVDSNEGVLMCELQHAMPLKFLPRVRSLFANWRIVGHLQVHSNVKREAPKMVNTILGWRRMLNSGIVPRNAFEAKLSTDLIKRFPKKIVLVRLDGVAEFGVTIPVVVCGPRWRQPREDQEQRESAVRNKKHHSHDN